MTGMHHCAGIVQELIKPLGYLLINKRAAERGAILQKQSVTLIFIHIKNR